MNKKKENKKVKINKWKRKIKNRKNKWVNTHMHNQHEVTNWNKIIKTYTRTTRTCYLDARNCEPCIVYIFVW